MLYGEALKPGKKVNFNDDIDDATKWNEKKNRGHVTKQAEMDQAD